MKERGSKKRGKGTKGAPLPAVATPVVAIEPEEDAILVDDGREQLLSDDSIEEIPDATDVIPAEEEVLDIAPLEPRLPATSLRDVVPYDPLDAYLREIGRIPQLTREAERETALKYYHHKDLDAAKLLITSNLWLVVKIARDYQSAAKNLLDLIQEGNMGLMEAVKNFDPYREVRFPSYAAWWIKAYVVRYVIANIRLVKLGTTQAQRKLFFNLKKEKEKLEREGFFPAPKLLADKLNVRESDVIEMEQRLGSPDVSVHTPLGADTDADLLSVLPDGSQSAEDIISEREIREQFRQSLEDFASTLKDKEQVIFRERLLGEEKATLQDLAEKFSLSRERIRQLESRLREKLREFLIERFGSSLENRDFDF